MKTLFALCLCACLLCAAGCQKNDPLPPEEVFQPGIDEPAPMPEGVVPVEKKAEAADLLALDSPPELTVQCGGEEVHVMSCGFTWVTEYGILCADAPAPLQMREQMTKLETVEETAVLQFEVAPDELYVHAWDDNCAPQCDGISQTAAIQDTGEIELLSGGYLYEVTAKWGDGETCGGTGTYVFYVEKLYPGNE